MSFDLFYVPCRFGTEPVEQYNPWTGKVQTVLPSKPLSLHDHHAIRDVLESVGADSIEDGCFRIEFADGGAVEVYASDGAKTGCMAAVRRGLTPDLLQFLFSLLRAADWIMVPAIDGNPAITALPGRAEGFAEFAAVVCHSPQELGAVLSGGFDGWKRYRDQILES